MHLPYADDGVLVYGLYGGESADLMQDFREQTGVTFPPVPSQGTLNRFSFPSGVGYPDPPDIVVGKDGTIRSIRNSFQVDEMDSLIQELLAEP